MRLCEQANTPCPNQQGVGGVEGVAVDVDVAGEGGGAVFRTSISLCEATSQPILATRRPAVGVAVGVEAGAGAEAGAEAEAGDPVREMRWQV